MKKRNIVTYRPMQILASEENVKQRYPWVAMKILTAILGELWGVDILRICPSQKQREKNGEKFLFSK